MTVIEHYDDVPASDLTVLDGIPITTALRTLIDIAPEVEAAELRRMVDEALRRGLFTLDEALARVSAADMVERIGAQLVRRHLQP